MADQELFSAGWTGKDELKLLHSLQENGYGSWVTISKHVNKSPEECYRHYHKYYFNWDISDMPCFVQKTEYIPSDFVCDFSSMDLPGKEVPHYNPLRNDFSIEPCDDSEKSLKITDIVLDNADNVSQELCQNDSEITKRLVLTLVDSYLRRLKWRETVKQLVIDHGLLDIYRMSSIEKTLSANEQLVKRSVRPFTRFLTPERLSDLEMSCNKELALVERIQLLKKYRSLGIKTLKGTEIYERLKRSRQNMKERKMKNIRKFIKMDELFRHRSNSIPSLEIQSTSVHKKTVAGSVVPLDISVCSGVDLLESDEKTFCSNFRILPDIFLRCKRQMSLEYKKSGFLRLMDARKLCRIDVNKTRKIYNFLLDKKIIENAK